MFRASPHEPAAAREQRRIGYGSGLSYVIEAGAFADLIVVDGDPLADLTILARPQQHLKAVIRDGAVRAPCARSMNSDAEVSNSHEMT